MTTTYKLHSPQGLNDALEILENERQNSPINDINKDSTERYHQIGSIHRHLQKTPTVELVFRKSIIVKRFDDAFVISDNEIRQIPCSWPHDSHFGNLGRYVETIDKGIKFLKSRYHPDGIILPNQLPGTQNNAMMTVLQNGDDETNGLVEPLADYKFPTVSFNCLGRFYNSTNVKKGVKDALALIKSGQLQILDYTPDEQREMSTKDKEYFEQARYYSKAKKTTSIPPSPPERGFVAAGTNSNFWHRSSTVLFYDEVNKMSLLLGNDENTYFGCELSGSPKTVLEALDDLIPEEIRNHKNLSRQGEWFFAPVDKKQVPSIPDSLFTLHKLNLQVEHENSNKHEVYSLDIRINQEGKLFALDPNMSHVDHASVCRTGWHTFVRNTAKRAFSEEGVD